MFTVLVAFLVGVPGQAHAETTNAPSLEQLVTFCVPGCRLQVDDAGKPKALVSADGGVLDLAGATKETPAPRDNVVGYWYAPTMDFLSRQKVEVARPDQAVGAVQLLHAIRYGPDFVKEKIYQARPFEGGWVVGIDHDFTHYPGRIQEMHPYELLVDGAHKLTELRQRCYHYSGSAKIYTNTVISVYEKEVHRNGGRDYPEVLEKALRDAWEKEKDLPDKAKGKQ
jgi:hypothetical protein